jgi:hypothetical protein
MPAQKPTPKTNLDKALNSFEKKLTAKFASKEELEEGLQAIEKKLSKLASKVELRKAIQALEEKLVAQLATKEELRATEKKLMATLASKDELQMTAQALEERLMAKLASKDEVQAFRLEFLQFKDESTRKGDERFDIVMQTLDKMYAKMEELSTEKAAAEHTFQRHENRLDNHETRISTLEGKESTQ